MSPRNQDSVTILVTHSRIEQVTLGRHHLCDVVIIEAERPSIAAALLPLHCVRQPERVASAVAHKCKPRG